MKKTSKYKRAGHSKGYHTQSVYVPGYEYSPWKKWLLIGIPVLFIAILVSLLFTGGDAAKYSEDVNNSDNNTLNTVPLENPSQPSIQEITTKQLTGPYRVSKVIDGDTIDVIIDGKTERLRLIGIDTPETVDPRKPVQCFGTEASNKAKELLTNQLVSLEADPSQGERDKYNRLLRYVYFEDGTSYNKKMIADGYAHEYTYNIPYKYQSEYKQAQKDAEAGGLGLWSPSTCSGTTEQSAAVSPSPTTTPTMTSSNCDPNYTPCVPNVSGDLDCGDISFSVQVIGTDRHRFDRDGDGYGCESN